MINSIQVKAEVESWNLPPVATRYAEACKALKQVAYKNVSRLLENSEGSYKLHLGQLALRSAQLLPILRAIQYHR